LSYNPGDVVWFMSYEANKPKYHLCVTVSGGFIFLNKKKTRDYPDDLVVPCSDIDCIPPTESGYSTISCGQVFTLSDAELQRRRADCKGRVSGKLLARIVDFCGECDSIEPETVEKICSGLDDWIS